MRFFRPGVQRIINLARLLAAGRAQRTDFDTQTRRTLVRVRSV
jgi:hypothetical protein